MTPRVWALSRLLSRLVAAACVAGFVVALVVGAGWGSVAFLAAAALWLAAAAFAGRRAG